MIIKTQPGRTSKELFDNKRVSIFEVPWYDIAKSSDDYYMNMWHWYRVSCGIMWQLSNMIFERTQQERVEKYKKDTVDLIPKIWIDHVQPFRFLACWYDDDFINSIIEANKWLLDSRQARRKQEEEQRKKDREDYDRQYKEKIISEIELFEQNARDEKQYKIENKDVIIALFKKYNITIPLRTHWFINEKLNYINTNFSYQYKSSKSNWSEKLTNMLYDLREKILNPTK